MRILLPCLTALLLLAVPGYSQARNPLELAVKATYLYKFAPFVEWPEGAFESPNSPMAICVVGSDPFGVTLDQVVARQRMAEHPIVVRRLAAPATGCHIVFIGGNEAFITQALDAVRGTPVLTVTDAAPGSRGIINFVIDANHVRFEIDDAAAARNRLLVSSKLLRLARSVRPRS